MFCPRARSGCTGDEWEPIPISAIAQAGYCLRRVALIINEQLWVENADTAKGRAEHDNVHRERVERRGWELKLYEYSVFSDTLGVNGKCDCVEARGDETGCHIPAADFPVRLYPVEFKHGKLRSELEYDMQLCAQALCLEEMYHTHIPEGALFYVSSHRRQPVTFTPALRDRVKDTITAIDNLRKGFLLPAAVPGPKCKRCSLREVCLPDLQTSAAAYCRRLAAAAKEVERE